MAHFTFEAEVVVPDGVEVTKLIGGGPGLKYKAAKIRIVGHSDTSVAEAKGFADDLGDNIKTAFA